MEETSVAGESGPDEHGAQRRTGAFVARRQRIPFSTATLAHAALAVRAGARGRWTRVVMRSTLPATRGIKLGAPPRSHITPIHTVPSEEVLLKTLRAASSTTRGRCANTSRLTGRS